MTSWRAHGVRLDGWWALDPSTLRKRVDEGIDALLLVVSQPPDDPASLWHTVVGLARSPLRWVLCAGPDADEWDDAVALAVALDADAGRGRGSPLVAERSRGEAPVDVVARLVSGVPRGTRAGLVVLGHDRRAWQAWRHACDGCLARVETPVEGGRELAFSV